MHNIASKDHAEPFSETHEVLVGEILRRARIHYGQTPSDIERALRIKRLQIEAIESGDYDRLPGRVYAIGFVRTYAEYLGLDGEHMVALFKAQVVGASPSPELNFPVPAPESKAPRPWVVILSLVLAALILLIWWSYAVGPAAPVNQIPPVSESGTVAQDAVDLPHTPAPDVAPPTDVPAQQIEGTATSLSVTPPPSEPGIILSIESNSWVEIKDLDGQVLIARVLQKGDKYRVPDRADLVMSLGNAGGVLAQMDGSVAVPIGESGEVLRNIPLDSKAMRLRLEQRAKAQEQLTGQAKDAAAGQTPAVSKKPVEPKISRTSEPVDSDSSVVTVPQTR
jgi:cytoskeleton protein RodZ